MSIFKEKVITSDSLTTATSNILNVFKNTITELGEVVNKAKMQAKQKEAEIIIATKEKEALESIADQNTSIIEKFNNLLS